MVKNSVVLISLVFLMLGVETYPRERKIVLLEIKELGRQMKTEDVTYVIKTVFDLKGSTLAIPHNCSLLFKGGKLKNGIILGNTTNVKSEKRRIFENIELKGTWDNREVYSEWLDFVEKRIYDNACNFRNLMTLCNGQSLTHLYMQDGIYYCSVLPYTSNIKVPSNVYWHNSASIRQLPTDNQKFSLVLLQKSENVTIDGGEFVGDVRKHIGEKGEWGHGIKLAGAKKIVLRNLTCREFWGDGIDIIEGRYNHDISAGEGICDNITIDHVKCYYNRRQGLSIEAGQNISIKNSEFAHTGHYKMTAPGCGLDIEPWCKNEHKINNIRIENCHIHDNNPERDFCVEANVQYFNGTTNHNHPPVNHIIVNKCKIGRLYVHGANTVSFMNCVIDDISHYNHGENIKMMDCKIKMRTGFKTRWGVRTPRSLTITRCKG